MKRANLVCLSLCAVLSLSACGGWHLRGKGPHQADFSRVYLKTVRAGMVDLAVRRELFNRGMQVVAKRADAQVVVELEGEDYDRRILSVDPDTGKVREIELGLETNFSVRAADGRLLIPREPLNWQIDYVFDESSLLGTVEQDVTVQQDLAEIAATTLVFRLQSLQLPATP
jgi:outer membrane lipopolysaccharide assembly protein LptE/RlpB